MKRILLCLTFCLLTYLSFSQPRADELKKIIDSAKDYKQKITAYINFNDTFGLQNFDEMLRLGNAALELARSKKDSFSIAVIQRQIGEAWYFKGKYDVAANYFYTSINVLEKEDVSKLASHRCPYKEQRHKRSPEEYLSG